MATTEERTSAANGATAAIPVEGLEVLVTCDRAMTGKASLRLSAKLRKQLRLKSATLASGTVKCASPGSKTLRLKPSKAVRRALKQAKGSVKVKLVVRMRAAGESAKQSTRSLRLTR